MQAISMGDRLTAGHRTLDAVIGVRVPVPQPGKVARRACPLWALFLFLGRDENRRGRELSYSRSRATYCNLVGDRVPVPQPEWAL
jgi:hypothetical protein